jgi:hypothetical protein
MTAKRWPTLLTLLNHIVNGRSQLFVAATQTQTTLRHGRGDAVYSSGYQ